MSTREHDAALSAYRIVHPEGPAFSTLDISDQARWCEAYGVAREINPTVVKFSIPMALTEQSFNHARDKLGGTPARLVTIIGSPVYGREFAELRERYKCKTIEIPSDAFITRWTWVMITADGVVWSNPVD